MGNLPSLHIKGGKEENRVLVVDRHTSIDRIPILIKDRHSARLWKEGKRRVHRKVILFKKKRRRKSNRTRGALVQKRAAGERG